MRRGWVAGIWLLSAVGAQAEDVQIRRATEEPVRRQEETQAVLRRSDPAVDRPVQAPETPAEGGQPALAAESAPSPRRAVATSTTPRPRRTIPSLCREPRPGVDPLPRLARICPVSQVDAALTRLIDQAPPDTLGSLLASVQGREEAWAERAKARVIARIERDFWQARERGDSATAARRRAGLEAYVQRERRYDLALAFAWDDHRDGRLAEAEGWFRWIQAGQSQEDQRESARQGLALIRKHLAGVDAGLAELREVSSPALRRLRGEWQLERGWLALERGDDAAIADALVRARADLGCSDEAERLEAWLDYRQGRYARALERFLRDYRRTPSLGAAEGIVASQSRIDPLALDDLPHGDTEPLKSAIARATAEDLFGRKRFLAAKYRDPGDPKLSGLDASTLEGGSLLRHRSGAAGQGRMTLWQRPVVEFATVISGMDRVSLRAAGLSLDSGSLSPCVAFGTKLGDGDCTPFLRLPETRYDDLALVEFAWSRDGWTQPYFTLGSTPLNGPITPVPTFRLGVRQHLAHSVWQVEAFNQPVRESLLSYIGQRDPHSFRDFGRVVKTGVQIQRRWELAHRFGLHAQGDAAFLSGQRVADNHMLGASLSLGYDLGLPAFDYFTLGPGVLYQHYDKNLNHYTLGHGGYFSPGHYLQAGLGLNFLTAESRTAVASGRLTLGFQHVDASPSPRWPGHESAKPFADQRADDIVFDFELRGAWRIAPQWLLGAGLAARQARGYEDYSLGLSLRFSWGERQGVLSSELPDSFLNSVY